MNFEQAIVQIKDTLVVMTEIQRRQAEVQRLQAEETAAQADFVRSLRDGMALHDQRMNHIDLRLSEITDKLDGLIGFMGGFFKPPQ